MRYLIRVDSNSIKKNEDAGQTSHIVPGMPVKDSSGSLRKSVNLVHSITPVPNYSFKYLETLVECEECHAQFSYKKLGSDSIGDGDNKQHLDNICPICGIAYCCSITFEKFNDKTERIPK